jgi:2-beta-glucuronyltransferase
VQRSISAQGGDNVHDFKTIVVISAFQDYRTKKRSSIHHITAGLASLGHKVTFLSTRFSQLSRRNGDSRWPLAERANRIDHVDGVDCYLWQTPVHPFATGRPWLDALTAPAFDLFARWPSTAVDSILAAADIVIVESGAAVLYLRRIRQLHPGATIIYYAADLLGTVAAHPYLQQRLDADHALIDAVHVRSSNMASAFPWAGGRLHLASFGIDPADYTDIGPSPYSVPRNAVSVGSMLFDPDFFAAVAPAYPDIQFHIIGCGTTFDASANVMLHPEMPFRETLAYIKHASVGVAPYRRGPGVDYLAESSLKLAQFDHVGLPSVCPDFAVGSFPMRHGYRVGDAASMITAFGEALARQDARQPRAFPSWQQVATMLIAPEGRAENGLGISNG